jgi:hypothetical protein
MGRLAGVMLGQPAPEIGGSTDVTLGWLSSKYT